MNNVEKWIAFLDQAKSSNIPHGVMASTNGFDPFGPGSSPGGVI